jgi:putative endonuclease
MEYYVYILKCKDESYYTGIINNIERRFFEHANAVNPTCYTFTKKPVSLVFCTAFTNPTDAISFEKKIKGWTRVKKEALIANNLNKLPLFSTCNNSSSHKHHKEANAAPFDSAQNDSPPTM